MFFSYLSAVPYSALLFKLAKSIARLAQFILYFPLSKNCSKDYQRADLLIKKGNNIAVITLFVNQSVHIN